MAARPFVLPALGLALFAAAIWAIHRELGAAHLADVGKALRDLPASAVLLSLLAAAAGYVVLALYDTLALAYLERPLPVRRSMLAGFVGYAFSHSMGLPLLTGGAVRYRLYTAWGLSGTEIAGVVAFNSITLWLGLGAMAVLGAYWRRPSSPPSWASAPAPSSPSPSSCWPCCWPTPPCHWCSVARSRSAAGASPCLAP